MKREWRQKLHTGMQACTPTHRKTRVRESTEREQQRDREREREIVESMMGRAGQRHSHTEKKSAKERKRDYTQLMEEREGVRGGENWGRERV